MFRAGLENLEHERLFLNGWSPETNPPGLRQPMAYVHHLRSHWKPERCAKLIVPTSWMESLALAGGKCGTECAGGRSCPFRHVRFESDAETRLVAPGEELPRNVVSQLLTHVGMDDRLTTFVPRAFEGIPLTRLQSNLPAMCHSSQSARRIDFALAMGRESAPGNASVERDAGCLLLGIQVPNQIQPGKSTLHDSRLGPHASIPEELTTQAQYHLRFLASLIKREAVEAATESFPEWLVLFGLAYDAHRLRVVAYVPHRRTSDVITCAVYIVDELAFYSDTVAPTCELTFEYLRFLLALTTLRRHVHRLSKFLFTTMDSRDGIRRTGHHASLLDRSAHDQQNTDGSESLHQHSSLGSSKHCSSEYSTCPSSVRSRGLNDVPVLECGQGLSSCGCFTSSCSACSSDTSDSSRSADSKYTCSDYMEPSLISLSQGRNKSDPCSHKLAETKRQEIIAWVRQVEHPVKDTYRMVVSHSHPRRQKVADSISGTRR